MKWHKVLDLPGLAEGRVTVVTAGTTSIALTRYGGTYGALENACPHQGGPLGEGSIEEGVEDKCWPRCPWHGWDFDPLTGQSPGGHGDGLMTYPVEEREDGIYVGIEEEAAHVRTNADVMAETLVNWGVKHVFGMVGHSNLGMADALRRREEAGELQFYGIRHEGAAAFACSAYGKLTGRVAACFTIAGPGATNLMTGLYDAKVDRAPMLALSGQVNTQVLGPGAFQEVDLLGAFKDVSAFNHAVYADSRHGELVSLALKNALLTRNPVTLVLPDEVQERENAEGKAGSPEGRIAALEVAPPAEVFERAVAQIREANRPLLVVGHGARFHMDPIVGFAEKLHIPVVTTFKGKGINSAAVFEAMNRQVQDDAIIAVDVGNNTYSFGRYFEASGRQAVLMSGYLGSIGFGYPAAMGGWAATTESGTPWEGRPVWCVTGDGGFGQYMMELLTAVKYGMNITHVLLHNDELGKITKEQRAGEFEVWKTDLHNPHFGEYAKLCGAMGIRVDKKEDLADAMARARDHQGPALVEVMTDPLLI